jgi:hypothetical protein
MLRNGINNYWKIWKLEMKIVLSLLRRVKIYEECEIFFFLHYLIIINHNTNLKKKEIKLYLYFFLF